MEILQPAGWKRPRGYSNGVAAEGRTVFVAGQIGWDETETFRSDEMTDQVRQALSNIVAVLAEAGAGPEHITRMTWYVTDRQAYLKAGRDIGAAYREVIGKHFPAMTVVQVSALLDEGAKVEIEATAVVPVD